MSAATVYLTRRELGERLHLSPRVAASWVEREMPSALLRVNARVLRYDAAAVERLERRVRGAGELHQAGEPPAQPKRPLRHVSEILDRDPLVVEARRRRTKAQRQP
jgi:hypothetical protein